VILTLQLRSPSHDCITPYSGKTLRLSSSFLQFHPSSPIFQFYFKPISGKRGGYAHFLRFICRKIYWTLHWCKSSITTGVAGRSCTKNTNPFFHVTMKGLPIHNDQTPASLWLQALRCATQSRFLFWRATFSLFSLPFLPANFVFSVCLHRKARKPHKVVHFIYTF